MEKASDVPAVGKIFGLGVSGYLGSAIEIEAVAFPAREAGKGYYRFNDTAGSMAKDSMFNAAAVVRSVTGKELSDYDVNINFVGGGNIDGPSAGCAITTPSSRYYADADPTGCGRYGRNFRAGTGKARRRRI